jgi:protein phosphatase
MQVAGRTDVGLIREHNEDNFVIVDLASSEAPAPAAQGLRTLEPAARGALVIVCDGMGGAAAGEVASSMAIETVSTQMRQSPQGAPPPPDLPPLPNQPDVPHARFGRALRQAAWAANARIHQASLSDEGRAGMGTTMTAVGVVDGTLVMAQVGDSRAYVLRGGQLTQVTRDQSLVNQLVETGQISEEQARMFEHSNVILQALGVQEEVEVLLSTVPLRFGDRIVVCTDGLTGVVNDDEVAAVLGGIEDMDEVCRQLVEMARMAGGPDNITLVAARFEGAGLPAAGPDDTVSYTRWRLDEMEAPPGGPPPTSWQGAAPATEYGHRPRHDPAKTFLSLMVLLAVTLGGLVVGQLLYKNTAVVHCKLAAEAGFSVHVDGRDVGLRTRSGTTELRLPPGNHRVGLRGLGAPSYEREIRAEPGDVCKVTFGEER